MDDNSNAKYRPVLSASQIKHILLLATRDFGAMSNNIDDELSLKVITTLAPFKAKIDASALTPAYTTAEPKASALELLGGTGTGTNNNDNNNNNDTNALTKEVRWLQAYNRYSENPESCTITEIIDAKEHMYLNDLFTPEEKAKFESQMGEF